MCLYSRLILNPKYKPNKKNGGKIPPVTDIRTLYVPIGCQQCIECRKQKANEWKARLLEDVKGNRQAHFVTLTFSNEEYKKLWVEANIWEMEARMKDNDLKVMNAYETDNWIATRAVRLFLERWRKKFGKSLRHWFVTELGHRGTENIHIHGIVWTDEDYKNIREKWGYGFVWDGYNKNGKRINYVNGRTVGYIVKYITKVDFKHKQYRGKILCSAGIGKNYVETGNWKVNRYGGLETREYYRTENGYKIGLPIYWRNKIYSDKEREMLWIDKLNKEIRWVDGKKIDVSRGLDEWGRATWEARRKNAELGYGNGKINWNRDEYENDIRMIRQMTRIINSKA